MSPWTRAIRVVVPPKYLGIATLTYGIVCTPVVACWSLGFAEPAESHHAAVAFLAVAAGLYGTYRVWAFHPALRTEYRDWLNRTPWKSEHPLPLGPIQIVWQDVIFLMIVECLVLVHVTQMKAVNTIAVQHGIAANYYLIVWLPVVVFLLAQLATVTMVCVITRVHDVAGGLLFGLGATLLALRQPPMALAIAVMFYVLARIGIRRSLHVVWMRCVTGEDCTRQGSSRDRRALLGWPFRGVGPLTKRDVADAVAEQIPVARYLAMLDWRKSTVLAGLVGWWSFVILTCLGRIDPSFTTSWETRRFAPFAVVTGFATIIAAMRWAVYCLAYRPPISFAGRILSGRWLIRGYDHVYVAPIMILLTGIGSVVVLSTCGTAMRIAVPIGAAVTMWLSLVMGPSLHVWQLTGHHRLLPKAFNPSIARQHRSH